MNLDVVDLITTVERTLHEVLLLRFQKRLDPVLDLAALKLSPTVLVRDFDLRYVQNEGRCYKFDLYNPLPDDGFSVIQPQDRPSLGRWLRITSLVTKGPNTNAPLSAIYDPKEAYCKQVVLHMADNTSSQEALVGVFGQTPSILLEWIGDDPLYRSHVAGALYHDPLEFQVIVISECLRRGPWAQWGSPVASEASTDPGMNAMIGQVRHLLAGAQLHIDGLESIEIGRASKFFEDLDQRIFAASLQLFVRTNFAIPDEDLVDPLRIQGDPKHLGDAPVFDLQNYISAGYTIEPGPGLVCAPSPGTAFIQGQVVTSSPASHTFSPWMDTYRDLLSDGNFVYTTVPIGANPPPVSPDCLRIGVTTTGATDIVQDKLLCSYSAQYTPAIQILP